MSLVRKDILNGWKEIARYVGRDTRTVERWEKLRGLPVRRVPGAGRATVYALITELDEWLENSKPQAADIAANGRAVDSTPAATTIPLEAEHGASNSSIELNPPSEDAGATPTTLEQASSWSLAHAWLSSGRRPLIARITAAVAVGLLCVLVSPVVRSHANPRVQPTKYRSDAGERLSVVSYNSKISGVNELYLQGVYAYEQR